MSEKRIIQTEQAPLPRGPYSQAVVANGFVFVAGQGPVDPQTGRFTLGDIRSQCELTLNNLEAILKASGTSLRNVIQCTVYLANLDDFEGMNHVYSRYFSDRCPARSTIQAARLLGGIKVEIDAIALIP